MVSKDKDSGIGDTTVSDIVDIKSGDISDTVLGDISGDVEETKVEITIEYPAGSVFTGHCGKCGIVVNSYKIKDDGKICEKCDYK